MSRAKLVLALAALLLALHAALAWSLRTPSITTAADDAVYLLLARGLRHLSYHNVWLVGAPAQAQYPPFYPAVLALAGAVTGDRLEVALALNVLYSTAALATCFALVRRWSAPVALLALAVTAVNPWLVRLAGLVASEPLFLLLLLQSLYWASRTPPAARARVMAGLLAIAAVLTRAVGVTLIPALLGQWLRERQARALVPFVAGSALLVGGWVLWVLLAPRGLPGQSYLADLTLPADAPAATASPGDSTQPTPATSPAPTPRGGGPRSFPALLVRRVLQNGRAYLSAGVMPVLALPVTPRTQWDNWAWLVVLLGVGVPGLMVFSRRLAAGGLLLACYTAVLLVWPYSVERYLAPVIPLMVVVMVLGARRLTERIRGVGGWVIPGALAGILFASAGRDDLGRLNDMAACDREHPLTSPGCFSPEQRAFFAAVAQADREASPAAVFLTPKPETVYYLTGRKSVDVFLAASLSAPELRAYLDRSGVERVLLSRVHLDQRWIARSLEAFCPEWDLDANFGDGGALLLRRATGQAGGQASCDAVGRFARDPW